MRFSTSTGTSNVNGGTQDAKETPRRKRRLVVSALIVGVPIVVFLIVNGVLVCRSDREVAARLDGIRAAGDPVTVADLVTDESVSPEEDAETIVRSVLSDCEAISEFHSETVIRRQGEDPAFDVDDPKHRYLFTTWPPSSPDSSIGFDDPIPRLHEASRARVWKHTGKQIAAPKEDPDLHREHDVALDECQLICSAMRMLMMHGEYCLGKGDTEGASRDAVALLRLIDKFAEDGFDVTATFSACSLRHTAVLRMSEMLQSHKVDVETLDRLDSVLARIDFEGELRRAVVGHRAYVITQFETDSTLERLWLARALGNRRLLNDLDEFDRILADPTSIRDIEPHVGGFRSSFRSDLRMYWDSQAFQTTVCRALRILIALKRMQNPDSLLGKGGALDPTKLGLPEKTVTDPYSGKPLIVRKEGDGWVIYSVGPDGTDDLGDVFIRSSGPGNRDVGIAPPEEMP